MPKKKTVFRCRQPITDFTFLIYTPKSIYLKKYPFFNANLLEKLLFKILWRQFEIIKNLKFISFNIHSYKYCTNPCTNFLSKNNKCLERNSTTFTQTWEQKIPLIKFSHRFTWPINNIVWCYQFKYWLTVEINEKTLFPFDANAFLNN